MLFAYIDSSALLSVAFKETNYDAVLNYLASNRYTCISSELLLHEVLAACRRTAVNADVLHDLLQSVAIVGPETELTLIEKALHPVPLRGADLFHIAAALKFAKGFISSTAFLTFDIIQAEAAKKHGFITPLKQKRDS